MREHRISFLQVARTVLRVIRKSKVERSKETQKDFKHSLSVNCPNTELTGKAYSEKHNKHVELNKYIGNKNNNFFQPQYSPATIKCKCQTISYFNKKENSALSEKQGKRKFSLKLRSKFDTLTEIQKHEGSITNETPTRRKFSLKSASSGGRKLTRERLHLSCPDLSLKLGEEMEMEEIVDCLDENTCNMFGDNIEHDGVGSELIEINAE